jgi:hypothetical protein
MDERDKIIDIFEKKNDSCYSLAVLFCKERNNETKIYFFLQNKMKVETAVGVVTLEDLRMKESHH